MDFQNKCFAVIGATSAVGRSTCRLLAENGASLFMAGRDTEKLESLKQSLPHTEKHATAVVNITEESFQYMQEQLSEFIAAKSINGIDGGVYCPGIAAPLPLKSLTFENITNIVDVNFTGALLFAKILAKRPFRNERGSSVIWITSIRSRRGAKALSVYCGTKAALAAACRALAIELAPQKVRINCIAPGTMGTEMNMRTAQLSPNYLKNMADNHPLGIGSPQDAANAIAFLLSDKSKWITGTELVVDGGFLA